MTTSSDAAVFLDHLNNNFQNFKYSLQSYFSNFTKAVVKVTITNKKASHLLVDLPIYYYVK
ncbi:CamS family sex pheromone protein, partial [Staphylococcus felis]|nr:CamS family sex pheromone protein [Staphylococcus felis]